MTLLLSNIHYRDRIAIAFIAFAFVTCLSSLSFLYDTYYPLDSAIYQIIGKGWTEGKIPYVDLWDQKGPLLYLINAIGYALTGNKFGLFVIEIALFYIVFAQLLSFYRSYFSIVFSYIILFVTICHLSQLVAGGNVIEEYILPLLLPAFFYLHKWSKDACENAVVNHPAKWAFSYGIILAFSLLTRLTNAVGVCVAVLIVFIYLVKYRKWNSILGNIIYFCAGFAIFTIPFLVYFYINDALFEMIYATIIYNIEYTGNIFHENTTWYAMISFLLAYLNTYGVFFISIILFFSDKKYRFTYFMWTMVSGITMVYFLKTFLYEHYAVISIPYFAIMLVESKRAIQLMEKSLYRKLLRSGFSFFGFIIILNGIYQFNQELQHINQEEDAYVQFGTLTKIIQSDKNVVGYNIHPSFYLQNQITPSCRFFALQNWYSFFSESIKPKIRESFNESKPPYIIIRGQNTLIDDMLKLNYKAIDNSCNGLVLYQKVK